MEQVGIKSGAGGMTKSRPNVPSSTVKTLYSRSGNRCCLCKAVISKRSTEEGDGPVTLGQIAHINAYSDGGPRANPEMSEKDRNDYDNLIVLCANCHKEVDGQEKRYTAEELKKQKEEHEALVDEAVTKAMPSVSFKELEEVTKWLIDSSTEYTEDVSLPIKIQEKISKNELTSRSENKIRIGTIKAKEVRDFIREKSATDNQFADKIKFGFMEKYAFLRGKGSKGDDLFDAMHLFASGNSPEYDTQAAGLAVLVYLFQACEVFEK